MHTQIHINNRISTVQTPQNQKVIQLLKILNPFQTNATLILDMATTLQMSFSMLHTTLHIHT